MTFEKPYLNHVLQVKWSNMASAKYDHGNEVDERLMNQVVKYVNYDELGSLARDIRVQNYAYESVSAKKDRIFAVSSQNMSTRKARILHQRSGANQTWIFRWQALAQWFKKC